FNAQLAVKHQFSDRIQAGLEFQYGSARYRFVETFAMREGYSYTITAPVSYLITNNESIQLIGIGALGIRNQGIDNPGGDLKPDSTLESTSIVGEIGLASAMRFSDKLMFQGGISFPLAFETDPSSIQEYTWVKLHAGAAYDLNRLSLFAHGNIGHAFGASGDTYKYIWSTEVGIRFRFGEIKNSSFFYLRPSF
ncbi:MAG: hypothetical protein AAF193_04430, partial [Bacteroidota bacterium]